ncbi:MAG: phospholipid carrier-dependent glycosyltransferase [Pseudomonadales bacterium]|nr:phospholipid carrier-dependent glycosyltransferase [Candidatus Woesebacteria bacterium]MCB9800925.1 phospholipid carrier-dependent glycosyltransferase [Pseudomonadales bacterium]
MDTQVFKKQYKTLLLVILFFAFFTRVYRLHVPERYIFDEVYHSVTAKLIAHNDPRAFEWWNPAPEPDTAVDWLHPPLAKYTQAASMLIFGENSFGWRISSALFGVGVLYLISLLSLQLTKNHAISLLATLLASLDGLLLVMSRIAMNDIHVTFAILLTVILYLKTKPFEEKRKPLESLKWYLFTGISAGLAMGTKWSGVFVLGILYVYELLSMLEVVGNILHAKNKKTIQTHLKQLIQHGAIVLCCFVILPLTVYLLSYAQMFLQGKDLNHLRELHKQIWWYQSNLTATHTYQSTPLEWIINKRPVWFHVSYGSGKRADIYAHGNSILLWSGLVTVVLTSLSILKRLLNSTDAKKPLETITRIIRTPLTYLLMGYFATWIVWIRSPRIMFFYHYTPAIPFLVILLAYGLYKLTMLPEKYQPLAQATALTTVSLAALYFIVFFPHWTALPMPAHFVNSVYFMFESWK